MSTATMGRQQVLRYGAFTLYFIASFVLFCYWTFPYGRLRDFIEQRAVEALAPTPASLSIGDLSPSWLTGVELSDVEFAYGAGEDLREVSMQELTVRVSPLSLLFGTQAVSFSGQTVNGSLSGEVERSDERLVIDAELESISLPNVGLGTLGGLPIEGLVSGTVELDLPQEPKDATGQVELSIARFALGDGTAKLKVPGMSGGFTLERVMAGTVDLQVKVEDGTASFEKVQAKGRDIDFKAEGGIRLGKRFSASRLDVTLEAKFSEAYKNRDGKTKALFELMGFQRQVKQATTPEGALRYRLGGSLAVPRATPAGKQRGRARTRGKR